MFDDLPDVPPGILPADQMRPHFDALHTAIDADAFRATLWSIRDEDEAKAMLGTLVDQIADRWSRAGVPVQSAAWWLTRLCAGFRHEWDEAQRGRPSTTVH